MKGKLKRILSAAVACVMVLSLLPAVALAEGGGVARIGDTTYATLDEAIAAADDGATIELLADAQATKTFYKSLTFTGGHTVRMDVYGWRYNGALVFDNANLSVNTDADSPVANNGEAARWFTMVLGGSISARNGANILFTFDSASGTNCAIYTGSGGVTINVDNASTFSIIGKNTKGVSGQGIQLDSTANTGIYVTRNSEFLIDGTNRGYVNSPTIYVEDSVFTVQNCTNNGSNGGAFTAIHSEINFLNNAGHGLSATTLEIKNNSVVTCCANGYYGVTVGSKMTMDGTSVLTANENGRGFTGGGLRLASSATTGSFAAGAQIELKENVRNALENYGTCTFEDGTVLEITHNTAPDNGAGIYNGSTGQLTLPENAVVMYNEATLTGGGIRNKGTAAIPASVQLYNNHAGTAGDDIYNDGTVSFGEVGSNWYLDGGPDCTDKIDGWYDDAEDSRWEAHDETELHVVEFTRFGTQPTALKAAHGILPAEPIVPTWETSKSKTATDLDENYESQVTLSLPAAEEQLVSDVVFVLDKSTSAALEDQALEMLRTLKGRIEETGAQVKVGVVIFNKVANVANGGAFFDLSSQYDAIETAIKQDISSGTNTHAGLLAGKVMLDADTGVDASRKYLIFVSDGITYMYNAEPTATAWTFWADAWKNWAGPDNWKSKYESTAAPDDWDAWLTEIGTMVKGQGTTYEYPYGGTATTATPEENWNTAYANSIDKALYLTCEVYQEAVGEGYHCYAMTADSAVASSYPWAASFMNYLAGGQSVDFTAIQNDIYYLLDAGSKVVDVIGEGVHDDNKHYNFDFVHDAESLTLTVGETAYTTTEVTAALDANETARYTFTHEGVTAKNGAEAPFVLHYYATGEDGRSDECFVWDINVPVSRFETVQLTYTVRLTDPQTTPGTYGAYDADGSEGYAGLYTNNSATLYPIDSAGHKVVPEEFSKPTVSYTVQPTGTLHVSKYVADDEAAAGEKYGFTVTFSDGAPISFDLENGQTETISGLPVGTGYVITETDAKGYRPTYFNETGTITENSLDAVAAVINVPADEGALVISKTVNNGDLNKEFTFTVTLKDAEGVELADTYSYTGSKTGTIASGGTVMLKNGESVSINNLPEGTAYTVTENEVSGYTTTISGNDAEMKGTVSGNTASGIIISGSAAVVHYTNTYQYTPGYPDPPVTPTTPVEPSKPTLNTEDHVAYIIGYPVDYVTGAPTDDMSRWPVKPQGNITRAEVGTIFFRLLTDESRAYYWSQTNPYSDVDSNDWFNNAISTLSNAGIITGYPDGTFRPNEPISRAEFAAIAVRFSEVTYNGGNSFTDVPESYWAARYIALAEYLGWINGYPDGTFKPEQNITRAESMTLINRVLERDVEAEHMLEDMVKWPDNLPGTWYYEAVQEATNSHAYVRTDTLVPEHDFNYEDWKEILAVPDWAALERTWSTANSK
ncbi:MAG: S-layer homology domain-containing protein [Oscillospiraceae bacterium]